MQKIGEKIKQARLRKGLTQKELAKKSGIHEMHISPIERGVANPTIGTLIKLCNALDLEIQIKT